MEPTQRPSRTTRLRERVVPGLTIALVIFGVLLVSLEWRDLREVARQARWNIVPIAIVAAAVSYACLSASFTLVSRLFGISVPRRDLAEVGFVSTALGNLVTVGGATGTGLRFLLLRGDRARAGDVIASSVFFSYVKNLVLLALLPLGLLHLAYTHDLPRTESVGLAVGAGLFVVLVAIASAVLLVARVRRTFTVLTSRLARRVLRASRAARAATFLDEFDEATSKGVAELRRRPAWVATLVALSVMDWSATVGSLALCFAALGHPVGVGALLTALVVGVALGMASLVPGGLGVQEGSMAGVLVLLGVPLQLAVLGPILFRGVYYVVPFAASLMLYRRLLRRAAPQAKPA